ncbi:unnamed protein product [Lupinus luteus]|uniref:TSL-kinase interacting protein 1 n=1 Tax=Lupinus luteus TaxID=3873 RepID=A0AAV1WBJ7_LUPLU
MKTSLDSKAVKASEKCNLKTGTFGVKKCKKRTNRLNHKTQGCGEEVLADKENQYFPSKESASSCPDHHEKDTSLMEKRDAIERHAGQTLASTAKIKLQLFPINKATRIGLEKDGHNPHLELTLSGQKKISSVLKHLEKKWGSSSIAKGDPMLFPFNIMENLPDCIRWTINDCHTTAAAVYAAVGSPAIFQLKYGWSYTHEPRPFCIPSTPVLNVPCVYPGGTEGGCNANLETVYGERDMIEVTSKEFKVTGNASNEVLGQKMENASIDPLDNEPKVSGSLEQPLFPWIDSLTNISIGGLLSEASLQGRFSTPDPKPFGRNVDMRIGGLLSEISLQGRSSTPLPKPFGRNVDMRIGSLQSETSIQGRPSTPDPKSFSSNLDISIGGVLSESSLLYKLRTSDPKSLGNNVAVQPSQIISDSFGAFIASQISHPPVPRLPVEDLRTSILDAEETCHAFPLKKLSSQAVTGSGNNYSVACSSDVPSNTLKFPNTYKVNDQDLLTQNPSSGKTQTDLSLSSCLYDDERSLGLTGIIWNDTLGPFDLACQAKKSIGGDSASIGGFVK